MFDEEYIKEHEIEYRSAGYKWMLSTDWSDKGCGTTSVPFYTEEELIEYKKDFETSRSEEKFRIDNLMEEKMDNYTELKNNLDTAYDNAIFMRDFTEESTEELTMGQVHNVMCGLELTIDLLKEAYNNMYERIDRDFGQKHFMK